MNLTIEGDLAKRLYILLKKDTSLARALALQWVEKVDSTTMYRYLLDRDTLLDLLSAMLQKDPENTMEDLKSLAQGKTPAQKRKVGRPRKAAAKKPGRPKKAKAKKKAEEPTPRDLEEDLRARMAEASTT